MSWYIQEPPKGNTYLNFINFHSSLHKKNHIPRRQQKPLSIQKNIATTAENTLLLIYTRHWIQVQPCLLNDLQTSTFGRSEQVARKIVFVTFLTTLSPMNTLQPCCAAANTYLSTLANSFFETWYDISWHLGTSIRSISGKDERYLQTTTESLIEYKPRLESRHEGEPREDGNGSEDDRAHHRVI